MIDFNKHNKGLLVLATLICVNADVFNTDTFVDLYTECDKCFIKDAVYLLYTNKLYDEYIKSLLRSSPCYFNERIVEIDKKSYSLFIFKVKKEDSITFNEVKKVGSLMLTENTKIKVCIFWKKYLDDSFIDLFNFWTCEQLLKLKG